MRVRDCSTGPVMRSRLPPGPWGFILPSVLCCNHHLVDECRDLGRRARVAVELCPAGLVAGSNNDLAALDQREIDGAEVLGVSIGERAMTPIRGRAVHE